MYCIPIGVEQLTKTEDVELVKVWLFLERNGTHCISVDTVEGARIFANENGFPLIGDPVVVGMFIYLPVDLHQKDALSSFYIWNEFTPHEQPMREAWRPFLWNSAAHDTWGTNIYLKELELATSVSCYEVIDTYISLKA